MRKPGYRKTETDMNYLECKKYKMTLEAILEFIQMLPPEDEEEECYSTNDFTLKEFQRWVAKRIEETEPIHNSGGARQ